MRRTGRDGAQIARTFTKFGIATVAMAMAALLNAAPPLKPGAKTLPRPAAKARVVLLPNGLTIDGVRLSFDKTPRAQAVAAATRVLGKPTETGSHGDCGQGEVIGFAKFAHDFELSFVHGKLSGWTEDGTMLATDHGLRVGATVAALRRAYPNVETDPGDEANGGLGPSFQVEDGPAGWLEGVRPADKVGGLFAGATCLAGV